MAAIGERKINGKVQGMGTIVLGSGVEVLPPGKRYIHYIDSSNQHVLRLVFKRVEC